MNNKQTLEKLNSEIKELQEMLDEVNPTWLVEMLREHTDENGLISESVCIPIRAAIKLLRQG